MSGYLELADGSIVGVRDGLVLGRVAACDVVVDDKKASRRHARLISEGGVVEVEDMGSSNGTLLNGNPVDRRMLRDGDRIEIGKTVVVYREGQMPGRPVPPAAQSSSDLFAEDDDLFGGGDAGPKQAAPARPAPGPLDDGEDLLSGAPDDEAPSPSAPAAEVVEFEDEVVEVQKAPTSRREEPLVEVRAVPRESSKAPRRGDGASVQPSSGRILQYSKKQAGRGPLGDDLGQMSGGARLLVMLLAVAIGAGIVYGIMVAMS